VIREGRPEVERGWLYYHTLTGEAMYRIKAKYLISWRRKQAEGSFHGLLYSGAVTDE
jgi:hypothetical protein